LTTADLNITWIKIGAERSIFSAPKHITYFQNRVRAASKFNSANYTEMERNPVITSEAETPLFILSQTCKFIA
jgi:hypothetical protein